MFWLICTFLPHSVDEEKCHTATKNLKWNTSNLQLLANFYNTTGTLIQTQTLRSILSQKKLLPAQEVALLKFEKQAPEAYTSQVGSIVELIQTLKNEYKKEEVDTTQQHEKDEAAQNALIKELKEALSGLQEQQQAGEGEAAAKAKRTQELNDLKDTLTKEIEDADVFIKIF